MKKKYVIKIIPMFFLLIFLSIIISVSIKAQPNYNTIYVNVNGGADFFQIQDAVNAAYDGDTIFVFSGTYYENVIIDKSINLTGEEKNSTIIDGSGKGDVIFLSSNSNWVNISKFTIQNAGYQRYMDGIDINSDYNSIFNNIIKNSRNGISIEFWGHNCKIYGNTIRENAFGILIYSVIPNNNIITQNNFIENNINAYDDSNSRWEYFGEGNYWDDYFGEDNNGDGIGDTPYDIPGGSTQDKYPLIEPVESPGFEIILFVIALFLVLFFSRKNDKFL